MTAQLVPVLHLLIAALGLAATGVSVLVALQVRSAALKVEKALLKLELRVTEKAQERDSELRTWAEARFAQRSHR
jgi:hypothetical protein